MMSRSYRTRVCERRFLNKPGFQHGAYVLAEIQDTSSKGPELDRNRYENPTPTIELEIADCTRRISLEFGVDGREELGNSLYKVDVLIRTLERFRAGLVEEGRLYRAREREVKRLNRERERKEEGAATSAPSSA